MAYERYISASSVIAKTPKEQHMENWQALIDQQIDNAYNWYDISVEDVFGSQVYNDMKARVTYAINPDTGTKLSDDWKQLIFQNEESNIRLGKRYQYYDNIWLTVNTENFGSPTYNCVIRRCNSVFNFKLANGKVHKEPVAIDNGLDSSSIYFNNSVNIAQGSITAWLQINDYTRNININDRFILGYNKVFKVKSLINFLTSYTFDINGATLMKIEMQQDSILSSDDFTQKTTNSTPNDFTATSSYISIEPNDGYVSEGDTVEFSCYYMYNGTKRKNEFSFSVLDGSVPTENYIFSVIDSNHFTIQNIKRSSTHKIQVKCINLSNPNMFIVKDIELGGVY